jgi:hypothetical protein
MQQLALVPSRLALAAARGFNSAGTRARSSNSRGPAPTPAHCRRHAVAPSAAAPLLPLDSERWGGAYARASVGAPTSGRAGAPRGLAHATPLPQRARAAPPAALGFFSGLGPGGAPEPAATAAPGPAARPPPFAALTRLLLTGQNSYYFRQALTSRRSGGGPISLLLFLLTIIAAIFAAIRGVLVRKVKGCRTCHGFGVNRCRLCGGEGRVDWAAKLSHFDACPLCMNRRYVVCSDCGGFYHRPLFSHARRRPRRAQDMSDVYALSPDGAAAGAALSMQETRND